MDSGADASRHDYRALLMSSDIDIKGLRYHHLGVPILEPHAGEEHVPHLGIHMVPWNTNPFGIELMRFDESCTVPDLVRKVPHLAFEVPDLDLALVGREVLIAPNAPSGGVRVAFIAHAGLPVELMEFSDPRDPRRAR